MNPESIARAVGLLIVSSAVVFVAAGSLPAAEPEPALSHRLMDEQDRLDQWSGYSAAKAEGRIVYVAGDGSGDFNCDGTDDHVEINQAIEQVAANPQFSTVHLKGPNTYAIGDTIRIGSGTILQGDATAVVKLKDHAKWPLYKAMVASKHMEPGVYTRQTPEPIRSITLRGFEMDGNSANNHDVDEETGKPRSAGKGYDYQVQLVNAYEVTINDMYLHEGLCDGIVFMNSGEHRNAAINSRFFNNRIEHTGHDGMYMIGLKQFEIHNNYVYGNRTNSAIRLSGGCSDYSIHDNVLRSDPARGFSGNAGVQVQNGAAAVDNVQIYGNEIFRMGLGGIIIYGSAPFGTQTGYHIHHNRISDCNIAGIRIYGAHNTLIENNVLYGNHGDGIVHYFVYGAGASPAGQPPEGQRYTTVVRSNIIADTLAGPGPDSPWGRAGRTTPVSGFGLNNCLPNAHAFISEHNCIYNNVGGSYNNASSTTDIYVDPLLVAPGAGDFRVQPGSPCTGAGGNGNNMGAY